MSFGQVDNGSKASPFSIASRLLLFSINLVLGRYRRYRIDVLKYCSQNCPMTSGNLVKYKSLVNESYR